MPETRVRWRGRTGELRHIDGGGAALLHFDGDPANDCTWVRVDEVEVVQVEPSSSTEGS